MKLIKLKMRNILNCLLFIFFAYNCHAQAPKIYTSLDEALKSPRSVHRLDLSKKGLTEFPKEIFTFPFLIELDLSSNALTEIPASIKKLEYLLRLDLRWNQLIELPASIGELEDLEDLFLGANQLRTLPESLGDLKYLDILELSANQIEELPSLAGLEELTELYICLNNLKELPDGIREMNNLEVLDFHGNKIDNLPTFLQGLDLTELNLRDFDIEEKIALDVYKEKLEWRKVAHPSLGLEYAIPEWPTNLDSYDNNQGFFTELWFADLNIQIGVVSKHDDVLYGFG